MSLATHSDLRNDPNRFRFHVPLNAFYKAGATGRERRIGGIISTQDRDRQGEVVLQRGLDFSEFLEHGWFNDNHSKATKDVVGFPIKVEKRTVNGKPCHYVEGFLLPEGHTPSDELWKLITTLQKTPRRLGFSIEGAVQQRQGITGETIAKAKVREVAITRCPVNTATELNVLTKSLIAAEAGDEEGMRRALAAGQAISDPGVAPGQGFPLRVESLERDVKDDKRRARQRRKLTKSQARAFLLSRYRGMTEAFADRLIHAVAAGVLA